MKKDIETIVPQPQNSIEDALEEALLVAEFFDRISRDAAELPVNLSPSSPLTDFLQTAQSYIDVPIDLEELSTSIFLEKRR